MEQEQKGRLIRILAAGALFLAALFIPAAGWPRLLLFLVPYGVIGWDVLFAAARDLLRGKLLDEHFLMAIATLGALALGEYPESVFVMLFYQIGEFFQDVAVDRSRDSVTALLELAPETAWTETPEGWREADPRTVAVGSVIRVRPGERIPLDGVILEGETALDTAALTGESLPRPVRVGDPATAGCVNLTGLIRLRVSHAYGDSAAARILDLVEHAAQRKAERERLITRFARVYTPAVVAAAALLALLPPLAAGQPWEEWARRALTFLVVSCPCALVISVPLSFFGGIGAASRRGILVKGGGELEKLAALHTLALDKTGTLTRGQLEVTEIFPEKLDKGELLRLAALAESASGHPIAQALCRAAKLTGAAGAETAREVPGQGLIARVEGHTVAVGNARLMASLGREIPELPETGTVAYTAVDGDYAGALLLKDQVKPEAAATLKALRALGVKKAVLLTGDSRPAGEAAARELALDSAETELLPEDKVARVETMLKNVPRGRSLAFVGDGINDAPVLTRADLGIAMGALGADAAIEAADVVLMDDRLDKLVPAVRIARRTLAIVRQNIVLALGVKAAVLVLGALGRTDLWMAAFADVGVALLATLNALRALGGPGKEA